MRPLILCGVAAAMLAQAAPAAACMPGYFSFERGSASIRADDQWVVATIARAFRTRPGLRVRLTASTDRTGSSAANMQLARRRGEAVRAALVRAGIPAAAVEVVADPEDRRNVSAAESRVVFPDVFDPREPGGADQSSIC
jgi:hypothetical protein